MNTKDARAKRDYFKLIADTSLRALGSYLDAAIGDKEPVGQLDKDTILDIAKRLRKAAHSEGVHAHQTCTQKD